MKFIKLKYYNCFKKGKVLLFLDSASIVIVLFGLFCFIMLFLYPMLTGKYLTPDTFIGGAAVKIMGGMAFLLITEMFGSYIGEDYKKLKEIKTSNNINLIEKIKKYIKLISRLFILIHTIIFYLIISGFILIFFIANWIPTLNKILSLEDIPTIQLIKNIVPEIIPIMGYLGVFGYLTFHFTAYYAVLNENDSTKTLAAKFNHWLLRIKHLFYKSSS